MKTYDLHSRVFFNKVDLKQLHNGLFSIIPRTQILDL